MNKKAIYIISTLALVLFAQVVFAESQSSFIGQEVSVISKEQRTLNSLIKVSIVTMPEASWNSGGNLTWLIWKYMGTFLPLKINTISLQELQTVSISNTDILIMADIIYIDTLKLDIVRNYVRDGGKLIVVGLTAKDDEYGNVQTSHRLGDVLGLDLVSWKIPVSTRYTKLQESQWYLFDKEIYDNFVKRSEGKYVQLNGIMEHYTVHAAAHSDSNVIMTLHDIKEENDTNNIYIDGVIKHNYGKGKTFFFPAGFENFQGWQSIDTVMNHRKDFGMYFMFMLYYSMVLDFYKGYHLPIISTAPNGRDGTVSIEMDVEGNYGKLAPAQYGVCCPEEYSTQAYKSVSTIWKDNIFENPKLGYFKGKWEFAILTKLLDGDTGGRLGNLTTNAEKLVNFLKQYGVIGAHSYNHLVEWNNGQLGWNCNKWEIDNTFRIWQTLVDNGLAKYPLFLWVPMIAVPNTINDIRPYVDRGESTVFWWADVRTPYQLIPWPLFNKSDVRDRSEFIFYTMPQAANREHGISLDWEPRAWDELSKYGISPILIYVWNDNEYSQVFEGSVEKQLLEIKSYIDNGRLEFLDGYQFNSWWDARSRVSFNNMVIDSNSTIFDINTPKPITGLTVKLQNLYQDISSNKQVNIVVDGTECKCLDNNTINLPLLSNGNHQVQVNIIPKSIPIESKSTPPILQNNIPQSNIPQNNNSLWFKVLIGITGIILIFAIYRIWNKR